MGVPSPQIFHFNHSDSVCMGFGPISLVQCLWQQPHVVSPVVRLWLYIQNGDVLPKIMINDTVNIVALEMASPGNRHCANCIGTVSFPVEVLNCWVRLSCDSPTSAANLLLLLLLLSVLLRHIDIPSHSSQQSAADDCYELLYTRRLLLLLFTRHCVFSLLLSIAVVVIVRD